jgi:hypothetical protein
MILDKSEGGEKALIPCSRGRKLPFRQQDQELDNSSKYQN